MDRIMKTGSGSFLKIMTYGSEVFTKLNQPKPRYGENTVDIVSITPVGTDKSGYPILCYELKFN